MVGRSVPCLSSLYNSLYIATDRPCVSWWASKSVVKILQMQGWVKMVVKWPLLPSGCVAFQSSAAADLDADTGLVRQHS